MTRHVAAILAFSLCASIAFIAACGGGGGGVIPGEVWPGTVMVNTTGDDSVESVAVDAAGNVYLAGTTDGDLHGHPNTGSRDGFVAVYNPSGGHEWTAVINTVASDTARSVAVDAAGNVYLAGETYGDLHGHASAGMIDVYLAKYGPAGAHKWTAMLNTSSEEYVRSVSVDAVGNAYVIGGTLGDLHGHANAGSFDVFLAKYSSTGVREWTSMINTSVDEFPYGAAVDINGNVYVAGETEGDLHGHLNMGSYDGFVAMYGSSGSHARTMMINTAGLDVAVDVAVDGGGNMYVAGATDGSLHGFANTGDVDGFVAAYNPSGGHEWTAMLNTVAYDAAYGVAVDGGGNVYVAGETDGDLHGHVNMGSADGFVAKYGSSGAREWTTMLNTVSYDVPHNVAVDTGGNVYVAGETRGDLHGHVNMGSSDGFVAKYSSSGTLK